MPLGAKHVTDYICDALVDRREKGIPSDYKLEVQKYKNRKKNCYTIINIQISIINFVKKREYSLISRKKVAKKIQTTHAYCCKDMYSELQKYDARLPPDKTKIKELSG